MSGFDERSGFDEFLHNRRNPQRESEFVPQREPVREPEMNENYEYETRPPRRQRIDEEEQKLFEEIDFYKQRLYKKIDSCLVRYGLEGLRRIDEGIANSLADYIAQLKGQPRPSARPAAPQVQEAAPAAPAKPFKKPVRIVEGPQGQPQTFTQPKPVQQGWRNDDVINKVLNDIIPPTEIHEVQINSNIPVDQILAERAQRNQKVDLAPQPQMEQHIAGDEMVEVGVTGEEHAETAQPVTTPAQFQQVEQQAQKKFDFAEAVVDQRSAREAESISMVVPPTVEEGNFDSGDDWDKPIEEAETVTPINVPPTPRKGKNKKEE